jgi:hypothetical protein
MPSPNSKVPSGKTSESSGKKPDKERLRDEAKMMKNGLVADCVVLVFLRLIVLRVWEDNGRFHYGKKNICETIFEVWEGEGGLVTGSDGGEQALLQSQEPLFGLASSSSDSVIGDIDAVDDGEAMSFSEEGDGLCNSEETVKVLKKIFHVAASYSPVLDENFAEVYVSGFFYHPLFTDTERSYAHQLKTRLTEMRSSGISHPSAYETATPLDDPRVALHILGYLSRYDFHGADATTMMRLSLVQFQQAIRVGSNKTNEGVSNDLCELLVSSIPNLSPESAILDIWCDKGQIFSGLGSRVDPRSYVGIDPCLTNVLAAECSVLLNSTNRAPKSIREEVLAFKFLTQNCLSLMVRSLNVSTYGVPNVLFSYS